ncbi:uncharacterized protein Nmag_3371 [Natrialba magadii ATCC 43099]|uniref:DUF1102 family protein n=1 Tax=Natrialba magadii (strain ATCC 43099 / DSM 3394 / CCM 3739 / CIP 104546 / IAM 13178 / JCM 8861 / NBRC 102185 / NCIMB 2190 / MS3) TaxID=547559 RepID=D3SSS6_NATMM|nr:DUF1102 domain-containing protein [Natrialba magadii]ADD06921.1 uncharacterized protein Nmag_3371 [Natrialba magadii ATCC 43099]ELY28455.1 hypothetical protein C500_13372 [Natrialba magadii ATCC 43099]
MRRRTLLLAVGGGSASALIGSGAFSSVQTQRGAELVIERDPDAYLGLDGCPGSSNASYTRLDERGHLEIDLSPSNSTIGSGKAATGTGVNSDSFTYFHNVFQVCNRGKEPVKVWIEATARKPASRLKADKEFKEYAREDRVIFYQGDNPSNRVDSEKTALTMDVGKCVCIGFRTMTKGLEAGDRLLADDNVIIRTKLD